MRYPTQQEVGVRRNPDRFPPTPSGESARVIPTDVQLERASQNQKLAEIRYDLAVRKGLAWTVGADRTKPDI